MNYEEKSNEDIKAKSNEINRAIEDAERMINFASKGKIDEQVDLKCLEDLAKATFKIKKAPNVQDIEEKDYADLFTQIALMSHILYPVTSESLKVMDGMAFRPCAEWKGKKPPWSCIIHVKNVVCSTPMLIFLAIFMFIIGLVVTPYVFNYSLEGSNIIARFDYTLKEVSRLNRELREEAQKYKSFDYTLKEASKFGRDLSEEAKKNISDLDGATPYKAIAVVRQIEINKIMLKCLAIQLDTWNKSRLGQIITLRHSTEDKQDPPDLSGNSDKKTEIWDELRSLSDKGKNYDYTKLFLNEMAELPKSDLMRRNMNIRNNGLLILQVINGSVLLLLFGCCGASAYVLRKTIQEIQSHTFTGIGWTTCFRILLGTFSGFFLGYLAGSSDLSTLLSFDSDAPGAVPAKFSLVSPLTLAFIGGYAGDLLFNILSRFIYALTNDERYLPAAEIMKRKVDLNKFIIRKNDTSQKVGK
jgi:hypothetical protein